MPRYRFEFNDPDARPMNDIDLPDFQAARQEAVASARDILVDATLKQEKPEGWAVRVFDEAGQLRLQVDFHEVSVEPSEIPGR
jgi:hypothetical protein